MQMRNNQVLQHFITKGVIATMRNYPYREGQHIRINRKYSGKVVKVVQINGEKDKKIDNFVGISSFNTKEDWIKEAKRLNKGKLPKYIVFVIRYNH